MLCVHNFMLISCAYAYNTNLLMQIYYRVYYSK